MRYQCIDCKSEFIEKCKVCPECRSRYIILVEQEQQEQGDQSHTRTEEEQFAGAGEQPEDKHFEAQTKLKEGVMIKVNETVAVVNMDAGDYYKVEAIKRDYYEEFYCLSECDENGVIEEGGVVDIPARSLDYWVDTDSIVIISSA